MRIHSSCYFLTLGVSIVLLEIACTHESPDMDNSYLFQKILPDSSHITFENTLEESETLNILTFEYFYNGAGVGVGDFNRDGLPDIFFSSNQGNSCLYLNKGGFVFEDVTQSAGINTLGKWSTGVSVVDINADGWLDIYVCASGPLGPERRRNSLFINQRDGTFEEQAAKYGLDDPSHSIQAAFFDMDLDGDLDVYLVANITFGSGPNVIRPKKLNGGAPNTDKLYENIEGKFVDISSQAGILTEGYGLGLSIRDINEDGWPDIYVSNDYLSNDLLYINQGDKTFKDLTSAYLKHTSYSAMGNDIADINNDGLKDIITVDMLAPGHRRRKLMFSSIHYDRHRSEILSGYTPQYMRNTLQVNRGIPPDSTHPVFSEVGQMAGVNATDWSWAPLLMDLDNDGYKDLVVSNGYPRDITNLDFVAYKVSEMTNKTYSSRIQQNLFSAIQQIDGAYIPNQVYRNQGELQFQNTSSQWGFVDSSYSHGTAYADFDLDGDLDLVFNNTYHPAFLYRNLSQGNNFIRVELKGPAPNPFGYGAKLQVFYQGNIQAQEFHPVRGFQSSQEPIIHFGLAKYELVDSLVVDWLDGKKSVLTNLRANQKVEISYQNAEVFQEASPEVPSPIFKALSPKMLKGYTHKEVHFADFHIQPLLPQKYSQLGPGLAVGDVNRDGKEDLFVGGAFKQSGSLFIQKNGGGWNRIELEEGDAFTEDMGCLLFDSDGDGDKDLYVASGGNEFPQGSKYYQDRLYLNDGSGEFSLDTLALPVLNSSSSCVLGEDIDQDGDLDLFVGGRLRPQAYPEPGFSQILENREGKFADITETYFPGLRKIGRVSSALWSDANGDGQKDLWVLGEWMPIELFVNKGKRWERITEQAEVLFPGDTLYRSLSKTVGWWNSISGGDFDRDGDIDYVLGNFGLNSVLKSTPEEPVSLYVADFNGDGKKDPILCHYLKGKEAPFHFKDDLEKQLVDIKKLFPYYEDYAIAGWREFYPDFPSDSVEVWRIDVFQSLYLENMGSLTFKAHYLPKEAQIAPIFGSMVEDLDLDGNLDLLLTGNLLGAETSTGAYDAFNGLALMGNGEGSFEVLSMQESGWYVPGEGKSLVSLYIEAQRMAFAAENNGPLHLFQNRVLGKHIVMTVDDNIPYIWLEHSDKKVEKREIYRGSGYLSQSSSLLHLGPEIEQVTGLTIQGDSVLIFSNP